MELSVAIQAKVEVTPSNWNFGFQPTKGTFMNPTSYFWKEIHDLPAGIGFGLFSSRHFAAVFCCGFGVAFALGLFLKCSKKRQDVLLKATALSLLAGMVCYPSSGQ